MCSKFGIEALSLWWAFSLTSCKIVKTDIILYDWQTQSGIMLALCKIIKNGNMNEICCSIKKKLSDSGFVFRYNTVFKHSLLHMLLTALKVKFRKKLN